MNKRNKILSLLLILLTTISQCLLADSDLLQRKDVQQFLQHMQTKHAFQPKYLHNIFANINSSKDIIQKISKPAEKSTWGRYKSIFLTKKRAEKGVKFWQQHQKDLIRAEKQFGVPQEIIVAIIGVETFYGAYTGTYPVLESLATLAFDYPPRSTFFKSELEQFLLLTREQKLDAVNIKGSYAGAMGTPQFISSSYREYAIDFANSGTIDIVNNTTNAIGSVANYFSKHGWKKNQPIAQKAKATGDKYKNILLKNQSTPTPNISWDKLQQHNVTALKTNNYIKKNPCCLFELSDQNNKEQWLGFQNFYVITRYNHSTNYAMAVYKLSQDILKYKNF